MTDQPNPPPSLLFGFRIAECSYMEGAKLAVCIGDTIHLSPAQYSLAKNATPEELEHLLSHLRVLMLPNLLAEPFPMTTSR